LGYGGQRARRAVWRMRGGEPSGEAGGGGRGRWEAEVAWAVRVAARVAARGDEEEGGGPKEGQEAR